MTTCKNCQKPLDADDIGAYQKFVDRMATEYLCVGCLAEELKCPEAYLRDRIEFLRLHGCGFFPKKRE